MGAQDIHCIMPPSPELLAQIQASLRRLKDGERLPAESSDEYLDAATLTKIITRPPRTRAHTLVSPTRQFASVTGGRKALVLLVDFSDKAATEQPAHFRDLLFSQGTYATGSMRDFYHEASYGQLDVTGEVSGGTSSTAWYRAPNPKSYYTNGDYGFGTYPQNAQKLVEDVLDLAAPNVDFSQYDNDGDGTVEALVIIAAGNGAEATGNVNDIWSHKWSISTPRTLNGVTVSEYFMAPEDGRVGVMAHELGHLLMGWPDLYDTDYSSAGTGDWDLMAGGSWNNGGDTPAHPCAWCKTKVGWVNPASISGSAQSITITPYATKPDVYMLPIGGAGSKQYFLLSDRHRTGFDAYLPGEGMVIEHVDENQTNNTDETHYLVDIEQADGKQDLNKNANRGDATDPFPAGSNNTFDGTSTPSSDAYDGSDTQIAVENIQRSGDNVTADVSIGAVVTGPAWRNNVKMTLTFTHYTSQWAWVHIDTVGWRRIKDGAGDGVTNIFSACCLAVAYGRPTNVYIDNDFLYTMYLL
jgi:immune inhibitor A